MKEIIEVFFIMLALIFCHPFGWVGMCIFFYGLYQCIKAKGKYIKHEK